MWMKIDDKLHAHRKTRRAITSHTDKRRDVSAMGLWVLAGSWAGQNGTGGWVPEQELDRWDDDWERLATRLVKAGFWWPEERDDEDGYGFVDWEDYNPANGSSEAGTFGNHKRWHEDKKIVKPGCPHCPIAPDDLDDPDPISGGDRGAKGGDKGRAGSSQARLQGADAIPAGQVASIGGRSGGDIAPESQNIALPDPTRPDPDPKKTCSTDVEREFAEWYDTYPRKRGKGQAIKAYRAARKKTDAQTLLAAVRIQTPTLLKDGVDFAPYPATWLNGERWEDQPDVQPTASSGLLTLDEIERRRAEREARERGESA